MGVGKTKAIPHLTFLSSKRGRGREGKSEIQKKKEKDRGGGVGIRKIFTKMKNTIHNTKLVLHRQTNKAENILGRSHKSLHCEGWGHCERKNFENF